MNQETVRLGAPPNVPYPDTGMTSFRSYGHPDAIPEPMKHGLSNMIIYINIYVEPTHLFYFDAVFIYYPLILP